MKNNIGNLMETFGKVVYSHKAHEKAIQRINKKIRRHKIISVILLSITSAGVVATFTEILSPVLVNHPTLNISLNIAVLIITLLATGLSVYDLSSTDKDDLRNHEVAASSLLKMREKYLLLLVDFKDKLVDSDELVQKRDNLFLELMDIYEKAPKTNSQDYEDASNALKENEEYTFKEGEVENFLPVSMREQ